MNYKRHSHHGLPCRYPWKCPEAGGNPNCTCSSDYGARWDPQGTCPVHSLWEGTRIPKSPKPANNPAHAIEELTVRKCLEIIESPELEREFPDEWEWFMQTSASSEELLARCIRKKFGLRPDSVQVSK